MPLALTATALAALLAAFVLTGGAAVARQPGPLLTWTVRHRYDIRLTALGVSAAIVLGTLIAWFGPGGPG